MGRNKRDITNFTEDLAFDANTSTLADTSDVLATVINELIAQGILSGTVSA
jgi:hypothetical protein